MSMKIYIGTDFDGTPTGVLLADSREKAEIAWSAMNDLPYSIEEIDPGTVTGIHGLVFLLTSQKCNSRTDFSHRQSGVDFRIWKRGN